MEFLFSKKFPQIHRYHYSRAEQNVQTAREIEYEVLYIIQRIIYKNVYVNLQFREEHAFIKLLNIKKIRPSNCKNKI